MFCPSCGKQIPDESVYCMWCGKPVAGKDEVTTPDDDYPATEDEQWYENVMHDYVAAHMKNPADCSWPQYSPDMKVTKGISKKPYILTYIDATNTYGGKLRCAVRIKLGKYPQYSGFSLKEPNETVWMPYL